MSKTMYEKIWDKHIVIQEQGKPPIIYIDVHLLHEVTSPQAFATLADLKLPVRRKDRTFMTIDHVISTNEDEFQGLDDQAKVMIKTALKNGQTKLDHFFTRQTGKQGIVHVIGPQLGVTQPGMTIVCGDSHTATHGAFGSIAFGIGTSEVQEVLATQAILQKKLKTMEIRINGSLNTGVSAKDVILYIINQVGIDGGSGYAIEYTGSVIKNMTMEQRMTICNMSIEAGARVGMIAPDATTFQYLKGREYSPQGREWVEKVKEWKEIGSDQGAKYDKVLEIDASKIEPIITYGTNPEQSIGISQTIPNKKEFKDKNKKAQFEDALKYMKFKEGESLIGKKIDYAFIGSCTNGRLSDLIKAASIIKGKKVSTHVKAYVIPGSQQIKQEAEDMGIAQDFIKAGFIWGYPSCSFCLGMNGDQVQSGKYCISSSNRNFEGRQGKGARTFLASPTMVAAAAVNGEIVDVRKIIKAN